jgi:imidazolonepropionase-like amidohydrolase
MYAGTDNAYELATTFGVRTALGTDNLFSAANARERNLHLANMTRWYTPAEVLKMATADNADVLALSWPRNPYHGRLGVVEERALADLLLVDGDPVANLKLIEDPAKKCLVAMKESRLCRNLPQQASHCGLAPPRLAKKPPTARTSGTAPRSAWRGAPGRCRTPRNRTDSGR